MEPAKALIQMIREVSLTLTQISFYTADTASYLKQYQFGPQYSSSLSRDSGYETLKSNNKKINSKLLSTDIQINLLIIPIILLYILI